MNRTAVVAGATGLVGRELVQLLLNEPAYREVTLLVRRPAGVRHPKLIEQVVDFNRLEQAEVKLSGVDVFCALGTTIRKAGSQEAFRQVDYAYPLALARMAQEQGAKSYLIVTSIGANPASRTFYLRVKGELEAALRSLGLPGLHLFRPSLLLGDRGEVRMGERMASAVLPRLSRLLGKYRPIQARTVALGMMHAAMRDVAGAHVYESREIERMAAEGSQ